MKTKRSIIILSIVMALGVLLYLVNTAKAPGINPSMTFLEMPWGYEKIIICYLIVGTSLVFGLLPWIPYLLRRYNQPWAYN